jgi:fused signal recognition particle receptor
VNQDNFVPFDPFALVDAETFRFLLVPAILISVVSLLIVLLILLRRRTNKASIDRAIALELSEKNSVGDTLPPRDDSTEGNSASVDSKTPHNAPQESKPAIAPQKLSHAQEQAADSEGEYTTLISRLRVGMSKTRAAVSGGIVGLFKKENILKTELLEAIHEVLYRADLGVKTADHLIDSLQKNLPSTDFTEADVFATLRNEVSKILEKSEKDIVAAPSGPTVILVVGVNGVGKTTTIGKLAQSLISLGKSVMLAAADTYRAAAIEQLKTWGERSGVPVIAQQQGSDPAAVAFDAVRSAKNKNVDYLLIDTAGRLHNKKELMDELNKIHRVIGREISDAPHHTILVLDATNGQNAALQVRAFRQVAQVSGLIVTKLDGTAKGGVVIGISKDEKLPIHYIGVGEKAEDLRPFRAHDFADGLFLQE